MHMGEEAAALIDQQGIDVRPSLPLLDPVQADHDILDSALFRDEEPIVRDRLAEDLHVLCWPDNVGFRDWALIGDRARDRAAVTHLDFSVHRPTTCLSSRRIAKG